MSTSQTTRRSIVRTLAAASLTALLPSSSSAAGEVPLWRTAIGLNGFLSSADKYKKHYPIWEILDYASRSGFEGVELVNLWPSPGPYPRSTESDRIVALRRLYAGFGLRPFSIQTTADNAFDPDESNRKRWIESFADIARTAKLLGCDCIGIWPGGSLRNQTVDQAIDRLAQSFHEVGKIVADLGMIAAFEIEPPFVFNKEDHLKRIHAQADHPNLKIIYDPSHFDLMNGSSGKPHELLERIGVKNIGYVQLTDTDGTLRDGGTSKHLPCGDGHANIAQSLRILRDGGFRGWVDIDAWEIPDPYDACTKGKAAIDAALR